MIRHILFLFLANILFLACSESDGGSEEGGSSSSEVNDTSSSSEEIANYAKLTTGNAQAGWGSRYWDGCKPSCSWNNRPQALGSSTRCKTCEKDGITEIAANDMNKSSCDEGNPGNSFTCFSQIPRKVNDTLAYAYAAAPSDQCGKCFQLQFDGDTKYGNVGTTHRALAGKTLIVMTSNMGGDVEAGQFDIMIPGGGTGRFDSFSYQLGFSSEAVTLSTYDDKEENGRLGRRWGGLLNSCILGERKIPRLLKECLENKCNETFSDNETLKSGCNFFADWMEAADNPTLFYKEVECPQYLIDNYMATKF